MCDVDGIDYPAKAFSEFLGQFYTGEEFRVDPPTSMLTLGELLPGYAPEGIDAEGLDERSGRRYIFEGDLDVWCFLETEEQAIRRFFDDYWFAVGKRSRKEFVLRKTGGEDQEEGDRSPSKYKICVDVRRGPFEIGPPIEGRSRKVRTRLVQKLRTTRQALEQLCLEFRFEDSLIIPKSLSDDSPLRGTDFDRTSMKFGNFTKCAFAEVDLYLFAQELRLMFSLKSERESRKKGGRPPADLAVRRLTAQLLSVRKGEHRILRPAGNFWETPEYGPQVAVRGDEGEPRTVTVGRWYMGNVESILRWRAETMGNTRKSPESLLSHTDVALLLAAAGVVEVANTADSPFDVRSIAIDVVGHHWDQIKKDLRGPRGLSVWAGHW